MDRTSALGFVLNAAGQRSYVDQNLVAGVNGTDLVAADRNAIQEEIMGVIEGLGFTGSSTNLKLMLAAILSLFNNAGVGHNFGHFSFRSAASPSGTIILQWGSGQTAANGVTTIAYPIAFPTECSAFLPVTVGAMTFGSATNLVFAIGGPITAGNASVIAVNAAQPGTPGGAVAFSYVAAGY